MLIPNTIIQQAGGTGDASTLTVNPIPDDEAGSGVELTMTAGETIAFGDPVYVKSDGKAWKADADGAATFPAIGVALEAAGADTDVVVLLLGIARDDAWSWTVGNIVYLSTSAGLTQTQPAATNDVIQVIGIATDDSRIFVNPSLFYITHV